MTSYPSILICLLHCVLNPCVTLAFEEGPTQRPPFPPGILSDYEGEDVLVTHRYGQVLGKRLTQPYDTDGVTKTVECFLGVPFASAPVGDLRFRPPVPPKPWSGIKKTARYQSVCPQHPVFAYTQRPFQNEDCLYLNIFVPYEETNVNATYPVMMYIHGGSYNLGGSSIYTGSVLAHQGVIVVTINYRLGLLGFFSGNQTELPGNYGLWDQIEALKWIHHNIRAFRGDPERVTVFGNSAGGSSVGFLLMSPKAKGLFGGAIAQSGSPLSFWALHNESVNTIGHARAVARVFGCNSSDIPLILKCMRRVPWKSFVEMDDLLFPQIDHSGINFKPVIDYDVIMGRPEDVLRSGYINKVPFITGIVRDEWTRNLGWFIADLINKRPDLDGNYEDGIERYTFEKAVRYVVTNRFNWPSAIADVVINEYTNWEKLDDPLENRKQYVHFFTDLSMLMPAVKMLRLLSDRQMPQYFYTFNHHSRHTMPDWYGSFHQVELNYLFGSPFTGYDVDSDAQLKYDQEDKTVAIRLMKLWANFAKYRKPTKDDDQEVIPWKQFLEKTIDCYVIAANDTRMTRHLRAQHIDFWANLIPTLTEELSQTSEGDQRYRHTMWVFVGISIALCILLVFCLFVIVKKQKAMNQPHLAHV